MVTGPPAATPVTTPLAFTVAVPVALLVHVTVCPVPLVSSSLKSMLCPSSRDPLAVLNAKVAELGAQMTLIVQVAEALHHTPLRGMEAVMVAEPGALAVTTPVLLTSATVVLLLVHTTVPTPAGETVAESVAVEPLTISDDGHPFMVSVRGVEQQLAAVSVAAQPEETFETSECHITVMVPEVAVYDAGEGKEVPLCWFKRTLPVKSSPS